MPPKPTTTDNQAATTTAVTTTMNAGWDLVLERQRNQTQLPEEERLAQLEQKLKDNEQKFKDAAPNSNSDKMVGYLQGLQGLQAEKKELKGAIEKIKGPQPSTTNSGHGCRW